jgi:hypothetical protein
LWQIVQVRYAWRRYIKCFNIQYIFNSCNKIQIIIVDKSVKQWQVFVVVFITDHHLISDRSYNICYGFELVCTQVKSSFLYYSTINSFLPLGFLLLYFSSDWSGIPFAHVKIMFFYIWILKKFSAMYLQSILATSTNKGIVEIENLTTTK